MNERRYHQPEAMGRAGSAGWSKTRNPATPPMRRHGLKQQNVAGTATCLWLEWLGIGYENALAEAAKLQTMFQAVARQINSLRCRVTNVGHQARNIGKPLSDPVNSLQAFQRFCIARVGAGALGQRGLNRQGQPPQVIQL